MMGGFGGLNNISANLMRNLGGLGGSGGLGGLGSILGGSGGLGGLGSILGGLGGSGGLGSILGGLGGASGSGGLGSILGGLGGAGGLGGLGSILGGFGGSGGAGGSGDLGNLDLSDILSQLGNMQKHAPPPPAPEPNMGPEAPPEEEPMREAQYRPVDEQSNGMGFNPAILQMLSSFLSNRAAAPQQPEPDQQGAREDHYERYGERPYDICFDCPLTCPRAGLKLPPYETVRQQARDWRRY